jgi:hypothetical protein
MKELVPFHNVSTRKRQETQPYIERRTYVDCSEGTCPPLVFLPQVVEHKFSPLGPLLNLT